MTHGQDDMRIQLETKTSIAKKSFYAFLSFLITRSRSLEDIEFCRNNI